MSRVVIGATLVSMLALTSAYAQNGYNAAGIEAFNQALAADKAKDYVKSFQLWTEVSRMPTPPAPPRMAPYNPAWNQAYTDAMQMQASGHYHLGLAYEHAWGVKQSWPQAEQQFRWAYTIAPTPHTNDYFAAVLHEIIIMYNGYAGQKSIPVAMADTQWLKEKPDIQQAVQELIQAHRIPKTVEQLGPAYAQYAKDKKQAQVQEAQRQQQEERATRNDQMVSLLCHYSTDNESGTILLDMTRKVVADMELGEAGKNIPFQEVGHTIRWSQMLHYSLNRQTMILESTPAGWPWHCQLQQGF
jgi:hypothetical protein